MEKVFAAKSKSGYVNALRKFAKQPRLRREGAGRIPISDSDIKLAEKCASQVADKLEMATNLQTRLGILMQYRELNYSKLAAKIGISRAAVQTWCSGLCYPNTENITRLCKALDIPASFLIDGDEFSLRCDDVIGLRFGESANKYKERLKELIESAGQGPLDKSTVQKISSLSRKSGGCFNQVNGIYSFTPWRKQKRATRPSKWPQEVEEIIATMTAAHSSIYKAHKEIQVLCEQKGLPCPSKVALYKRMQAIKRR